MKVLPAAAETRSAPVLRPPDQTAVDAMCFCLGTPFEISGTVHLQARSPPACRRPGHCQRRRRGHGHQGEDFPNSARYRVSPTEGKAVRLFSAVELDTTRSGTFSGRRSGPCACLPAPIARYGASPPFRPARRSSSPSSRAPSTSVRSLMTGPAA